MWFRYIYIHVYVYVYSTLHAVYAHYEVCIRVFCANGCCRCWVCMQGFECLNALSSLSQEMEGKCNLDVLQLIAPLAIRTAYTAANVWPLGGAVWTPRLCSWGMQKTAFPSIRKAISSSTEGRARAQCFWLLSKFNVYLSWVFCLLWERFSFLNLAYYSKFKIVGVGMRRISRGCDFLKHIYIYIILYHIILYHIISYDIILC